MVCANIRASFRVKKSGSNRASIDWSRLVDPRVNEHFNLEVKNRFEALRDETASSQGHEVQAEYDALLESVQEAAKASIGIKARPKCHHWVSERSQALLAKKDRVHTELASIKASESERAKSLKVELKNLAQRVTESLAEDERSELECFLEQLETADRKHDASSTWKIIKKIAGKDKRKLVRVRSKNGPFSDKIILSEWRLYSKDLLNAETYNSGPPLPAEEQPRIRNNHDFNTSNFSREEVDAAIKSLKNNKAPGVDNLVTAELLKGAGDYIRDDLRSLCNKVLSGADPPWQWTTNKIVPVPKRVICR